MIKKYVYNAFMFPIEFLAGPGKCRKHLIPMASGKVIEVGPGTGANAGFYDWDSITELILAAPEPDLYNLPEKKYKNVNVKYVNADVHSLPFQDRAFDTVVATFLFCSVKEPLKGLREIARVLKPGGKYLFMEHVMPSSSFAAGVVSFAAPCWKKISGGCCLDRNTEKTILEAGFNAVSPCRFLKGFFIGGVAVVDGKI